MKPDREPDIAEVAEGIKDFVKGIAKGSVYRFMDALKANESVTESDSTCDTLTYVQVLEYAIDKKLKYPKIRSTLLKMEPSSKGLTMMQVFTDETGELLLKGRGYLGRKIVADGLDEELRDAFGNEESVVIELP